MISSRIDGYALYGGSFLRDAAHTFGHFAEGAAFSPQSDEMFVRYSDRIHLSPDAMLTDFRCFRTPSGRGSPVLWLRPSWCTTGLFFSDVLSMRGSAFGDRNLFRRVADTCSALLMGIMRNVRMPSYHGKEGVDSPDVVSMLYLYHLDGRFPFNPHSALSRINTIPNPLFHPGLSVAGRVRLR